MKDIYYHMMYPSKYSCQLFNSTCDKNMCWKWQIFYLNKKSKIDLNYILKIRYPVIKKKKSIEPIILT